MKRTNRQLALSFLITVPAIVGAVILAGHMQELPIQHVNIGLAYLAWPIALGALITLEVDLLCWSSGVQRIRTVLNVPEEFKPRVTLILESVRNSTITAAWSMLLAVALVVLAQFGSQPTVYYNLMGVAGIVLASRVSPIGYAVPFGLERVSGAGPNAHGTSTLCVPVGRDGDCPGFDGHGQVRQQLAPWSRAGPGISPVPAVGSGRDRSPHVPGLV